jgi:hypothetical protein
MVGGKERKHFNTEGTEKDKATEGTEFYYSLGGCGVLSCSL